MATLPSIKCKIFNRLDELWDKYPELRFCQMMENILTDSKIDPFYLSDEDFLKLLSKKVQEKA